MEANCETYKFRSYKESRNYKRYVNRIKDKEKIEQTTDECMTFEYGEQSVKICFDFHFKFSLDEDFFFKEIIHKKTSEEIDKETENEMLLYIYKKFPINHPYKST